MATGRFRIKSNCRVSTEAWRCDESNVEDTLRWSYQVFGINWRDARIIGTTIEPDGNYWKVRWDIDGTETSINQVNLMYENDQNAATQTYPGTIPVNNDAENLTDDSFEDDISSCSSEKSYVVSASSSDSNISEVDILSTEQQDETNIGIINEGEAVYLCHENDLVFRAEYAKSLDTSCTSTGKFFIYKIMPWCKTWDKFDKDVHTVGASVTWEFKNIKKIRKKRKLRKKRVNVVKPMLPPCSCKKLRCHESLTESIRQNIHDSYWGMGPTERKLWLYQKVTFLKTRRPSMQDHDDDTPRRRLYTRVYRLPYPSEDKLLKLIKVCQCMFINTLGYKCAEVINTLHKTCDFSTGRVSPDKRGKHAPKHKITDSDDEYMTKHVWKYQPCRPHFRREHAPLRMYLPSEIDVKEMYDDYVECCVTDRKKTYSYVTYYRKIKALNISFVKLGIEECEKCDEFEIHANEAAANPEGRNAATALRKKTRVYDRLDKELFQCSP